MPRATTVRFSDEMFARLDQASARTGMPVNSIVVAACLEWMQRHTPPPAAPGLGGMALAPLAPAPRWATIRRAVELAVGTRPTPGAYPFEGFTASAQSLLTRAQAEAKAAGFSYIGTEHLLVAAAGDPASDATRILATLGVTQDAVRSALEKVLTRRKPPQAPLIVPTSRVRTVIELAFKLGHGAGDPRVGTGHILLALSVEGKGIASHLLDDLGAKREAIEKLMAEPAEPEP